MPETGKEPEFRSLPTEAIEGGKISSAEAFSPTISESSPLGVPGTPTAQMDATAAEPPSRPPLVRATERFAGRDKLEKLGNLKILGEVARGGMGIVYRAADEKLGRTVALKILLGEAVASPMALKRFELEARAAASLRHPNIVAVYEVGQESGLSYFTMDFIEGRSLGKVVTEDRPPLPKMLRVTAKIARALQYAHERKIVHRDVKPSNILVDAKGEPYLTDFGLAMLDDASEARLTKSGAILGTPAYMPPEQAEGLRHEVGPRSDVYSLGATLYEMLTLRPPFIGNSNFETIRQVLDNEPVPPRKLDPRVPIDVETICLKALEKDPAKRYQTAAALADDIERFLRGEPIAARPAGPIERLVKNARCHPLAWAFSTVIVGLVVGATGLLLRASAAELARHGEQELRATAAAVAALESARVPLRLAPFRVATLNKEWGTQIVKPWLDAKDDLAEGTGDASNHRAVIAKNTPQLPEIASELARLTDASFVALVHDTQSRTDPGKHLEVVGSAHAQEVAEPLLGIGLGTVVFIDEKTFERQVLLNGKLYDVVAVPWYTKSGEAVRMAIVAGFKLDERWLSEVRKIVLPGQHDDLSIHLVGDGKSSEPVAADLFSSLGPKDDDTATGEYERECGTVQAAARSYPADTAPRSGELYMRLVPSIELRERALARTILPIGIGIVAIGLWAVGWTVRQRLRAARELREESDRLAEVTSSRT